MATVRRLTLALVTPFVATLIISAPAAAQSTVSWNNSADSAWLTPGNWSPPATFPGTTNNGALANGNAGDTASFDATLPSGNFAGIDMSGVGGAAGALQLGAITFSNNSGSLTVGNSSGTPSSSGTLRLNGANVNGQPDTILSNTGTQTLTIQNNVGGGINSMPLQLGTLTNGSGYVVAANTGSTISISTVITDALNNKGITIPGSGTVILSGANNYAGTTLVTGGTLQVANTSGSATGSGFVGVASPGRLSGTGTITTGLGLAVGGKLQPGTDAAAGTLTVNGFVQISGASSRYIWSLSNAGTAFTSAPSDGASDGSGQSRLVVSNNLLFAPGTIDVTGLGSTGFDNTKFYSWTVASAGSVSVGSTPTFNTTGLNTGGGTFTLSTNGLSVFVSFSPVPEPGSILLCCVAAAGVTSYVRRKRAARSPAGVSA